MCQKMIDWMIFLRKQSHITPQKSILILPRKPEFKISKWKVALPVSLYLIFFPGFEGLTARVRGKWDYNSFQLQNHLPHDCRLNLIHKDSVRKIFTFRRCFKCTAFGFFMDTLNGRVVNELHRVAIIFVNYAHLTPKLLNDLIPHTLTE